MTDTQIPDWSIRLAIKNALRECNCGLGVSECNACCMEVLASACEQLLAERDALKKDQGDWRKGVALIASYSGEKNPENLCCVRIARNVLAVATENAALKAKLAALEAAAAEVHEKLRINADGKATVTVGKAISLRRELGDALAAAKI